MTMTIMIMVMEVVVVVRRKSKKNVGCVQRVLKFFLTFGLDRHMGVDGSIKLQLLLMNTYKKVYTIKNYQKITIY